MTASQRAVSPLSDVDSARHSTSDERSEADELEKMRSDEDIDGTFAPIQAPPADEERMQKLHSSSSRPIERSWSLNDGYSCHTVDEEAARNALCNDGGEADESSTFVVSWDENDPMNPRNFNTMRRWLIVIICSLGSLCVTCTSSMYTATYDQITEEFNCSRLIATLGLSFFIWGLGIGPLFLGPLSEFYGRRYIYITSFTIFLIWLIPCAVAKNIETMIVCRFFNGIAGSAFLSVAGGTVGDLFARHELSAPMMLYTASPFVGPEVGPLVGGFINQFTTWRWTFYVLLIWTGVMLISIVLFVPETYHPVLLRQKAEKLRKETGDDRWKAPIERLNRSVARTVLHSIYRPVLLLTLEPMCLCLCIFSAILLGIIYLFFGAFQLVFGNVYGFELWQRGLCFLGLFVGMVLAILSDPFWRRVYQRLEEKHKRTEGTTEDFQPEWRLPPAILGGPLVTIGLFIFAWTIYPYVHWIVPIIGSAFFGAGSLTLTNSVLDSTILVYSGIFTFLVDAYLVFAASSLAANSFARSTFGGVFPLFGIQMYNNLGYHWASSLLAFLTLAMAPFP
ncbi:MFS transporter [Aspergillus flavus]|nr:MFS transporter [Aspergillus flavus]